MLVNANLKWEILRQPQPLCQKNLNASKSVKMKTAKNAKKRIKENQKKINLTKKAKREQEKIKEKQTRKNKFFV